MQHIVSSPDKIPWSSSKIHCCTSYFQLSSWCFVMKHYIWSLIYYFQQNDTYIFLVFTFCEFHSKNTYKQQKRYFGAINVLNTGYTWSHHIITKIWTIHWFNTYYHWYQQALTWKTQVEHHFKARCRLGDSLSLVILHRRKWVQNKETFETKGKNSMMYMLFQRKRPGK